MKRTPLKRGTPLRRKTPMKRRRVTPRRSGRVRDLAYMKWVKTLDCRVEALWASVEREGRWFVGWQIFFHPCSGEVQADHAGAHPAGRKADDNTCIPMCRLHHGQRHDTVGVFHGWDQARMRTWLDEQITVVQRLAAERR